MAEEQSIAKVVEGIIDALSESVSQLILLVIAYQEQNAAPPPQLPTAAGQVDKTARVLVDVARGLADEEYSEYPDIKKEILDAAAEVEKSSSALLSAINILRTASDRKAGWEGLVDACKVISGKTILLLQIVYGAELKRIFAAADQIRRHLTQLDTKKALSNPQEFADAAGDVATRANQLAEYLKAKARDEDSPYLKAELNARAKELEDKAAGLIDQANVVLANPEDQGARNTFDVKKRDLEDTIKRATDPLVERLAQHEAARGAFDSKMRQKQPPPVSAAPPRPTIKPYTARQHGDEQAAREARRAALPAHEANVLNSADKLRDTLEDIREAAPQGHVQPVEQLGKQADMQLQQLARDVKAFADKSDDPAAKRRALDAQADLERLLPPTRKAAAAVAANPNDANARKGMDDHVDKMEEALDRVMQAVSPGEALASTVAAQQRDIKDVATSAGRQDAPAVAAAANAVGKRRGKLAEQAKAQAERTDDPSRKQQILDAVTEADALIPRQLEAATRVLESPSEANRSDLGNLTGRVNNLLDIVQHAGNPTPHQQLAEHAEKIRQALDDVDAAQVAGDKQRADNGLRELDRHYQPFQKIAHAQADLAQSPAVRRDLQQALQALQPPVSSLPTSARRAADNKNDAPALQKARTDADDIRRLVNRVEGLTNARPLAEIPREDSDVSRLANAHKKKDPKDLAAAGHAVAQRQARLAPQAAQAALQADDPVRRKNIISALDALERQLPRALKAAENLNQSLDADTDKLHKELARLGDALNPAVPASKSTRYDVDMTPDQQPGRKRVLDALARLAKLQPVLQQATARVASAPNDPEARKALRNQIDELAPPMAVVTVALVSPAEQLAAEVRDLNDEARALGEQARAADPETADSAAQLGERHAHVAAKARGFADRFDDPARRKALLSAIDSLDKLQPRVRDAALAVAAKPGDADAKRQLARALNDYDGALAAVAQQINPSLEERLVNAYDAILKALARTQDQAKRGDENATEEALANARDLLDAFNKDAKHEADRTRNPKAKKDLQDAVAALENSSRDSLPRFTRGVAKRPQDAPAQRNLEEEIARIKANLRKVLDAAHAEPVAAARREQTGLAELETATQAEAGPAAAQAATSLADQHAKFAKLARADADRADDPAAKKKLLEAADNLDKLLPATLNAARAVAARPNDKQAQEDLADASMRQKVPLANAVAAIKPTAPNHASAAARELELQLNNAQKGARAGDGRAAEESLTKAKVPGDALHALATAVANATTDPRRRDALLNAAANLLKLLQQLVPLVSAAAANPQDKAKRDAMDEAVAQAVEEARRIEEEVRAEDATNSEKVAQASARGARAAAKAARRAGSAKNLVNAAKDLSDELKALIDAARREIDQLPLGEQGKAALELEKLLAALDSAAASGGGSKEAAATSANFDKLLQSLNNKAAAPAAAPTSADPLSNALNSVAQELQDKTRQQPSLDKNDKFVVGSNNIAEAIARLAAAAAKGNRQEILLSGAHLAKLINAFCNDLKEIAARTKDPRFAHKLINYMTTLRNVAVQMKILCSVKAASTKDTPDTDEQLITIARALSRDVTGSLDTVSIVKTTRLLQ